MTSIGLHITKCAGTSLMSSVRQLLTEDQYVLLSSFYENFLASRSDIWDIVEYSRVSFVFGHYIHEDLFYLFAPKTIWDVYLFTGIREPNARAISQFYQLKKATGREPDVEQFISQYGSSMCDEIIRAFPSLANGTKDSPKWMQAAEVLTAFDYIYSTEEYSSTIGPVYNSIGLKPPSSDTHIARDNVSTISPDPSVTDYIHSALSESDDNMLYAIISSSVGCSNAGKIISERLGVERKREELLGPICQVSQGCIQDVDYSFLYDMMGYELHLLGDQKKGRILDILERKRSQVEQLIGYLRGHNY